MNKLNLFSPIGGTGYGVAGFNLLKNFDGEVSLFLPSSSFTIDSLPDKALVEKCIENQAKFDYDAPFLKIWHQFDLATRVGRGKYFAYPFFELDTLTEREIHHLGFADTILVPSLWARRIVKKFLNKECRIIPCGVDTTVFNPTNVNPNLNIRTKPDNFVFLNAGKWEKRKGHDILIECFNKAFKSSDSVELWMVPDNQYLTPEDTAKWQNLYKNSPLGNKVKLFSRLPHHANIAHLINLSDCVILPSRAEGWNLEATEALACGKPLIITNYSAHREYCNPLNSLLVDIDEVELANDDRWFFGTGNWAKIGDKQKDQIIQHMRDIYNKSLVSPIPVNHAGMITAKEFSWKNSCNMLTKVLYET